MTDPHQNSLLRISDEKTVELITLYEQEPCLWDTTQAEYRSRDYRARYRRAKAAERIARKLRIRHFEAKHVLIKFKNLRNSYSQELKKMAAHEGYRPRVFWFANMDAFLRPHMQPTRGHIAPFVFLPDGKLNKELEEEEEDPDPPDPPSHCSAEPLPLVKREEEEKDQQSEDDMGSLMEPSIRLSVSSDDDVPLAKKAKETRPPEQSSSSTERALADAATQLASVAQALHARRRSGREEDALDAFGRYVASLLRSMPPPRAAALQPRVVALLTAPHDDSRVSQSDQNV